MKPALIALTALALAACGTAPRPQPEPQPGGGPTPTPIGQQVGEATTMTLGPEGGRLATADGKAAVEVPAGALAAPTTITVTPIENKAPGGLGTAYRLTPHGVKFAKPVKLSFKLGDETLGGAALQAVRVAYQTQEGYWAPPMKQGVDAPNKTVTAETDHFSDWSPMGGVQLDPFTARVKVGKTVDLKLHVCEEVDAGDPKNPLDIPLYHCQSNIVVSRGAKNWSVNGATGGNATVGTVSSSELGKATYTAPAKKPSRNPVAVSVQYTTLVDNVQLTLIANVTVEEDAGQWGGTVSYTEEGSKPWTVGSGFVGSGTDAFKQAHTFKVVGVKAQNGSSTTLLLEQTGSAEYTSNAQMEKKVYAVCQAGGPQVLRHHYTYARALQATGSVKETFEATLYVANGKYSLDLLGKSAHTTGQDAVTDVYKNGCDNTTHDYSYTKPYKGVGTPAATIKGNADPKNPTAFAGGYDKTGGRAGMPTGVRVEWNLTRTP